MAFKKKTWVNVPDPSNPPSIPEGQDALARFDAENMNRIEDGVENAHILINGKAPDGHGLGGRTAHTLSNASFSETMEKGCGFYQVGTDIDTPLSFKEWMSMIQITRDYADGIGTGTQLAFYDFAKDKPRMWIRNLLRGVATNWAEVLHTGNAPNLVLNAIENLPISKGGTGGTTASGAANNLKVKSIGGGTEIPEKADLNSYITVGNYVCPMTATAQTLYNCPVSAAFMMTVGYATGGTSYIYQELTHFSTGVKYYRVYTASSQGWSEWRVTYSTANKPTLEDIGAIVTGTFTGDGNYSQFIELGFTPKTVFVQPTNTPDLSNCFFCTRENAIDFNTSTHSGTHMEIVNNGFKVYYQTFNNANYGVYTNSKNNKYLYTVFK